MARKRSRLETLIATQAGPITRDQIRTGLRDLGLKEGMTVLTHVSLSSIGWIPGGGATVALCLRDVLGPEGTIVVPTQSSDLSDPVHWSNPPIPKDWFEITKETMAPFDPNVTPSSGQGVFPEIIRNYEAAKRSTHPHTSFAALGRQANEIVARHDLDSPLGKNSPLQKLYDLDASVLFIGTTFDTNTSFHLAEEAIEGAPREVQGAPMLVDGQQKWVQFEAVAYDTDDFPECGAAFEKTQSVKSGLVGQAQCKLFRVRSVVDFAITWFREARNC